MLGKAPTKRTGGARLYFGGLHGRNPTMQGVVTLQFVDDAFRLARPGLRRASLATHYCGATPPHSPKGGLGTHSH